MAQTKKLSFMESLTQTIIGLVTSFLIQIVIYPTLNIEVSLNQNIIITLVFFVASIVRGYIVRRLFNKI